MIVTNGFGKPHSNLHLQLSNISSSHPDCFIPPQWHFINCSMATAVDSSTRSKLVSALKGRKKDEPSTDSSDREENSSTAASERRNSLEGSTVVKAYDQRPASRRSSESSNRNRKLSVLLKRLKKQPSNQNDTAPQQQDESIGDVKTGNSSTIDLRLEDNASGSNLTEDSEEP
jgi:hypothetical protein